MWFIIIEIQLLYPWYKKIKNITHYNEEIVEDESSTEYLYTMFWVLGGSYLGQKVVPNLPFPLHTILEDTGDAINEHIKEIVYIAGNNYWNFMIDNRS